MSRQIIKQPNSKYAVYSSICDSFILLDATKEQVLNWRANEAAEDARESCKKIFDKIESGKNPYYQFALSWQEAAKTHNENCEDKVDV